MEELTRLWSQNSDNIIMVLLIGIFLFKSSIIALIFGIKNISVSDFQSLYSKANLTLLDVRTQPEYYSSHINGAKNLPLDEVSSQHPLLKNHDKSVPLYVICASGNRSLTASVKIKRMGYNVTNIKGGMAFWQLKKLPVVSV